MFTDDFCNNSIEELRVIAQQDEFKRIARERVELMEFFLANEEYLEAERVLKDSDFRKSLQIK